MGSIFRSKTPKVDAGSFDAFKRFTRSQRRSGAFTLMDANDQYARWNKAEQKVDFDPHIFLGHVTTYTFKAIIGLWQQAGMKDSHRIMLVRDSAEKGLYLS